MNAYTSFQPCSLPWAPRIPSHWKMMRNAVLFQANDQDKVGDAYKSFDLLSLTTQGIKKKNLADAHGKVPASYEGYQKVKQGDMVFCLFDLDCSAVFSGLSKYDGMITSAYDVLSPKTDIVNPSFLDFWYQSVFSGRYYKIYSKSVRYTVNYDTFRSIQTPIPPRSEQDQIVRYLDWQVSKINKLIAAKKREIELLKEQWQNEIDDIVIHGLKLGTSKKESGISWIGTIPETWSIDRIRQFCVLQNGISEAGDFFTSGYPFVNYGDVYKNRFLPKEVSGLAKSNTEQQQNYSVKRGDIFFTRTSENIEEAGMTSVCLITIDKAVFSGFLIRVRPIFSILIPEFAGYYFQYSRIRDYFAREMNIVIRASVSQNLLKNLPVLIPPIEEQEQIALHLQSREKLYSECIANIERELSLLKECRTKLISDVVTGQIDVRDIVVPEFEYVSESADANDSEDDETTTPEEEEA